jgi:hypothetical protein
MIYQKTNSYELEKSDSTYSYVGNINKPLFSDMISDARNK